MGGVGSGKAGSAALASGATRSQRSRDELDNFIENMVRIGVECLADHFGAPVELASKAMRSIAMQLCADYATREFYVPKDYDLRDRLILAKFGRQGRTARAFTAGRIRELAAEFELSARRVYAIVNEGAARRCSRETSPATIDDRARHEPGRILENVTR